MTSNSGDHLLLTVEQVAEELALSRSRVYELLAAGALPSIHIGRSRRVALGDLRNFVNGLRSGDRDAEAG